MAYDSSKTSLLAQLRSDADVTQQEAAEFFGLKDRGTISAWENGRWAPGEKEYRNDFILYLWSKLGVQGEAIFDVWNEIMEREWGWKHLSKPDFGTIGKLREVFRRLETEEVIRESLKNFQKAVDKPGPGLLPPEHFRVVSYYRCKIADRLDGEELAYALRCSIQHGMNVPFWSKRNKDNPLVIDYIFFCIVEQSHRRPSLRAGYALQQLEQGLKEHAINRLRVPVRRMARMSSVPMLAVPQRIVESAEKGRLEEFINEELREDPTYVSIVDPVLRELLETPDC